MNHNYATPLGMTEVVYEIKKSRFIARLARAADRDEAMAFLALAKHDYSDARHHCWAYLLGPYQQPKSLAMSDDGEPSGTAGKPILNVMQHKEVGDVVLIVIRYFGGIKLGAGGLVRAYSQAAQRVYEEVMTETNVHLIEYCVMCDFSDEQAIRHWLKLHEGRIKNTQYSENVILLIALEAKFEDGLKVFLGSYKNSKLKLAD